MLIHQKNNSDTGDISGVIPCIPWMKYFGYVYQLHVFGNNC